ncbi:RNA polymerase-binding transcription factor DksA [Alphaproteobacteria bacterium]|nr:RNA polymerase-binding transcription factor DksA [Alphaproteobacteria bacterium]
MAKIKHYLTEEQLEYFKAKLLNWKAELIRENGSIVAKLNDSKQEADVIESASNLAGQAFELRTKDRARKLIYKIDKAISRIDDGSYGYCEEYGVPIGFARLNARPIATLCIEAQEVHEKMENDFCDDV